MKFNSNKDQNKSVKNGNDLASNPEAKNSGKYTFEEKLRGYSFVRGKDGISKRIDLYSLKEAFLSFDEALSWLIEKNQDNWNTVRDAWGTFHGGVSGFPVHLIEKYKPKFDA